MNRKVLTRAFIALCFLTSCDQALEDKAQKQQVTDANKLVLTVSTKSNQVEYFSVTARSSVIPLSSINDSDDETSKLASQTAPSPPTLNQVVENGVGAENDCIEKGGIWFLLPDDYIVLNVGPTCIKKNSCLNYYPGNYQKPVLLKCNCLLPFHETYVPNPNPNPSWIIGQYACQNIPFADALCSVGSGARGCSAPNLIGD